MYVDVILRQKGRFSDMLFSYRVPDSLENKIDIGYRVSVPFGKSNKPIEAIVNNLKSENESEGTDFEIKEIFDVLGDEPLISRENMELISWMRDRYICTYLDCLNLFFPKGYTLNSTKIVKPVFSIEELTVEQEMSLDQAERKIINELYLSKEDVSYDSLTSRHSKSKLDSLISKGLVNIQWSYKEVVNEKKIKTVYLDEDLKCKIQMDSDYINCLKLGKKQLETVNFLILNDAVEQSALLDLLGVSNQTIKSLEKKGIIKIKEESHFRAPKQFLTVENKKIDLNSQQREVVDRIIEGIREQSRKPYLIHGVTGSGKTEVFLELIEYVLSQGMESVFLVPEIALTPQTIARVKNRFGNIVGVFHSQLSEGEKYDVFREVKNGNIRVVIGTRSAIFLPFDSLGLIIIDEEHDFSYKSEKTPKYDAIEVARYKAFKSNVAVVLGSATPSVPDYYNAKNGDYELLELNKRANNNLMPEISIVDMRKELHSGNSSPLSKELVAKMDLELKKGNQVILFLNKRGYANFMECKYCGHVFKCKNCDITLTNHKSLKKGICHYCGYEEHIPERCPKCNMTNIGSVGVGTEKIEELVSNLFPNHKTLRMDRDSTKKKNGVQKILEKFNK
ncbi:replication restart helicase PriA [Peptostreptococcus porci]|nr:primosomal protein N' [Peptostreptococcus porci]MDD7183519.1 primosomal protein N' [Peptostreptococcus porci]